MQYFPVSCILLMVINFFSLPWQWKVGGMSGVGFCCCVALPNDSNQTFLQ